MSDFHIVMPTGSTSLAGGAIADFQDSGTVSDVVSMKEYETAYFLVHWGVGTTGTSTITALPIDEPGGTATTAIPFQYKRMSAGETNTAWTTSSSLATTAGSEQVYMIKVKASDLPAGYPYVYLNIAELVNGALLGGCIILMADPRYNEATLDAVTV
jgi:hypothetical protein